MAWARRNKIIRRLWFFTKWNPFRKMVSHLLWRLAQRRPITLLDLGNPERSAAVGVVHSDIYGGNIRWDLRLKLPLRDQTVKRIYSSHTLEHLSYSEIVSVLDECWRVLVPGGVVRFCLPNARLFIESYVSGTPLFDSSSGFPEGWDDTGSAIDGLNYVAYLGGEHKFLFDAEVAVNLLKRSGFREVNLSDCIPAIDGEDQRQSSFYLEGVKKRSG